jgi:hypothetical protein
MTIKNMKAGDVLRVSGDGEIDMDSTCTDGDAYFAGAILVDPGTSTTGIEDSTLFALGAATAADVWAYATRELTGIGVSGIASEANATTNRSTLQGEHSGLSAGHASLSAEHTNLDNGHTALGVQNTDISNRLPTGLQNGRMKANVDAIGDSATVDGVALDKWAELVQAMVNGRFKKDFPVAGQVTFYKRDNTTVLTVVNVTDTERTRVS